MGDERRWWGVDRVACVQMRHADTVDQALSRARTGIEAAAEAGADLALLPEYFFAPSDPETSGEAGKSVRALFEQASADRDVAVAGNVVEPSGDGLVNLGVVYVDGEPVLEQPKIHPMAHEVDRGVAGGDAFEVAEVAGAPSGMIVCADVLFPEIGQILARRGAKVLLNPVMSPMRADDPTREARESLYVARSYDAGAFVVKAGGVRDPDVAGRSLVAAPWGLVARYEDDTVEELLVADLDLAKLDRFREDRGRFPKRRPEAYGELVEPDG